MLITDDTEVTNRISSLDNLVNRLDLRKIHNGGRPRGRKNDSNETRLAVATHAIVHGPTSAAKEYSTTPSRASLLSDGVITHGLGSDSSLAPEVKGKKDMIHEKALDIIMASLDSLNNIVAVNGIKKATDLAAIASDMAKIAERTGGKFKKDDEDNKPRVQVIVYAPRIRESHEYEEVEI